MVREFKIKDGKVVGDLPYMIAEGGINHNGDIKKAKMMIKWAKIACADCIKFQTHIPDAQMLKDTFTAGYVKESIYKLLKKVELSKKDHIELKKYADKIGINFASTPFSKEAVDLLEDVGVQFYKVGSGQIVNHPLLRYISSKGKPMIVSTGMTPMQEITEAVDVIPEARKRLALMHCTSTYPTRFKHINLKVIGTFKKCYGLPVGFSDHSLGISAAIASYFFGAQIIEKHFTISKKWPGPDQFCSLEPSEFIRLTSGIWEINQAIGDGTKRVLKEEIPVQKMARESIVSIKDIKKGEKFTTDNIWYKRPGTGIPAKYLYQIIDKKAKRHIKKDRLLTRRDTK